MTSRPQRRRYVVLSVLGLFALLGATGLVYADPGATGWHLHHGHMGYGHLVPDHSHPWEGARAAAAIEPADGTEDVVFTPANDGSIGSSVSMPRAYVAPALPHAPRIEAGAGAVLVPPDQHPPPLAEPPRA